MDKSPNIGMSKLPANTLEQIKKQGLSISLVNNDSSKAMPLDSTVSKETRSMQNINLDRMKVPLRSSVTNELKTLASQARIQKTSPSESRIQNTQPLLNSISNNQNKQTVEVKGFTKQMVQTPSEGKTQTFTRVSHSLSVDKLQNYKGASPENNPQNRFQVQQNQTNQNRAALVSSPPQEGKSSHEKNISAFRITAVNPQTVQQQAVRPIQAKINQPKTISLSEPNVTLRPQKDFSNSCSMRSDHSASNSLYIDSMPLKKSATVSEVRSSVKVTKVAGQNISAISEKRVARQSKVPHGMQAEKAVSQVVKVASVADLKGAFNDSEDDNFGVEMMPLPRSAVKRNQPSVSNIPKKKFITVQNCDRRSDSDINTISSDEGSPLKDQQYTDLNNRKGLTITAINTPTNSSVRRTLVPDQPASVVVLCGHCKQCSLNMDTCSNCKNKIESNAVRYVVRNPTSVVVTENVTTTKEIVYKGVSRSIHFERREKVLVGGSPVVGIPRGKARCSRRRKPEPVCYTLSSDDEDPIQEHLFEDPSAELSNMYAQDDEGSKSSNSELNDESNAFNDCDDFPGVTDINEKYQPSDEEEVGETRPISYYKIQEVESEEEEDEIDEEDEEEISQYMKRMNSRRQSIAECPMHCRSVRIGELKIHPQPPAVSVPVTFSPEGLSFPASTQLLRSKLVEIKLHFNEVIDLKFHFGRCLPILFIAPSRSFKETVLKAFGITHMPEFEPLSGITTRDKLTFLIETVTENQKSFLRDLFPGEGRAQEVDQKEANALLVASTPTKNMLEHATVQESSVNTKTNEMYLRKLNNSAISVNRVPRVSSPRRKTNVIKPEKQTDTLVTNVIKLDNPDALKNLLKVETRETVVIPISTENTRTPPQQKLKVIHVPVMKILTYPPPPVPGGITITTEDMNCLEEGEFLNDVIIDFYLKYIYHEKLSDYHRNKTHIFSSYFYPRLTQKPERALESHTMPFRRHSQVKKWTKNVDIFDKDFIIIPVNLNIHWFLAIICYPGKVPNTPLTAKSDPKDSPSSEEQEECMNEQNSINEGSNVNQDENSMNSNISSPYTVEEPQGTEESSPEPPDVPDSTTPTDSGSQRKETPCICIFDSLSGPNRWRIAATLREYLEIEWTLRKGTKKTFDRNTMQGFVVKCPQQNNYSDCGLYLLQYVESFFENPIPYFGNSMPDLTKWFSENLISEKRINLQDLIKNLQIRQKRRADQANSGPASPSTSDNR